jgi:hypothetical protein
VALKLDPMLGFGEVSEWLIELVSKTSVPSGTVGSNPTLSGEDLNCGWMLRNRVNAASLEDAGGI